MNELQEEYLAEAYRWVHANPRPIYGTQWDRFGIHVPPMPWHCDCSGSQHSFCAHVGFTCGLDTKDMWADVARGLAVPVSVRDAQPADLLLHAAHTGPFRAGPTEHVEAKVYNDGATHILSVGSSGSRKGMGYVSRPNSFWRIALHYHAMDMGKAIVLPPPAPPKENEMKRFLKGDKFGDVWLTNWLTKRHMGDKPGPPDKATMDEIEAIRKAGVTDGKVTIEWPQDWVDNIPEVKD